MQNMFYYITLIFITLYKRGSVILPVGLSGSLLPRGPALLLQQNIGFAAKEHNLNPYHISRFTNVRLGVFSNAPSMSSKAHSALCFSKLPVNHVNHVNKCVMDRV